MTWEYALIGLAVGFILGAVVMRFGNSKLRQQKALQEELDQSKNELEVYRQELVSHFARSADLLKSMANDYHQLHQHMVNSSNKLLSKTSLPESPFEYRLGELDDDVLTAKPENSDAPPRDYSNGASGLLRPDRRE